MNKLKQNYPEKYKELLNSMCDRMGVGAEEIEESKSLGNDIGYDSLDNIEFLMDCERIFEITIDDDEAEKLGDNFDTICNALEVEWAKEHPKLKLYLIKTGVDTRGIYDITNGEVICARNRTRALELTDVYGPVEAAEVTLLGDADDQQVEGVVLRDFHTG